MGSERAKRARGDVGMLRLVAQLYYERGLTQQDIAELTGFSISKVSRLHRQAREAGIVRITVEADDRDLAALEQELTDALGVRVHLTPGHRTSVQHASRLCGAAAAPIIADLLPDRGVVAWCGGNTIDALIASIPTTRRPYLSHLPAVGGGDASHPHLDSNGLIRRLVQRIGGRAYALNAPGLFDSSTTKQAVLAESNVAATVRLWLDVSLAVIGVSGPPDASADYFTIMDRATPEIRAELAGLGVVGDVIGHLFDLAGKLVGHEWSDRTLGMSLDEIARVPQVVAVLAGDTKARSLVGLARTGLVHTIVTDSVTAEGALELVDPRRRAG